MRQIEVCLSPRLIDRYELSDKIVVVTDVLRATSAMVTGFAHGVKAIRPVSTVEACAALASAGYLTAAEREGRVVDGFTFGNSPFAYMQEAVRNQKIALTTTNGTNALQLSANAAEVIVGAFLNLQAVVQYLRQSELSVLVVCAGWKENFNLEDTLFAGGLVSLLKQELRAGCDAALASALLYEQCEHDLFGAIQQSSHYHRLAHMGIEEDIRFCMQRNQYAVVPRLIGEELQL
ncbi:MAG: 2-phosphosulfolactate phosphatase [Bacteroidia bacterium]